MANTITYTTLFEQRLQERLDEPQNWKEFADVLMTSEQVIRSSYISTTGGWAAAAALTRGTSVAATDVAETSETLTISTGRHVTTYFDFADLAQSPWTTEDEIYGRAGSRLGEYIENTVLARHASWRNLGGAAAWTDNDGTALAVSAGNVDDLARLIRQVIRSQNGQNLAARNGVCAVLSPVSFAFVEAFAQANGFASADDALKNGLAPQVKYLVLIWYISNENTADHAFAGVRKIERIGILDKTFGKMHRFPGGGGAADQVQSGITFHTRVDVGSLTPTAHANIVFDVNDSNS